MLCVAQQEAHNLSESAVNIVCTLAGCADNGFEKVDFVIGK